MTVTVKDKLSLAVPPEIRRRAGIRVGDELEFKVSGKTITITPKRSKEDDEYTEDQRRVIDQGIAEGLEDIRMGRVRGPFETADAAIAELQSLARSRSKPPFREMAVAILGELESEVG